MYILILYCFVYTQNSQEIPVIYCWGPYNNILLTWLPQWLCTTSNCSNAFTHTTHTTHTHCLQEILHQMYEQGAQFSKKDYTNALKLLAHSQPLFDGDLLRGTLTAIDTFFSKDSV